MLGIGTGFDTKGKNRFKVYRPLHSSEKLHTIEDTREAWVSSLGALLKSYLLPNQPEIQFDYSKIREAGKPLKTFGG